MAKVRVVKRDDHDDDSMFNDAIGRVDDGGNLRILRVKETKDQYGDVTTSEIDLAYFPTGSFKYYETLD